MTARILPEAEEEIGIAAQWYENRQAGLGEQFLTEVVESLALIERHPRRSALYSLKTTTREIRCRSLSRFPYHVYYEVIDESHLVIFAVGHAHRRPTYWGDRG